MRKILRHRFRTMGHTHLSKNNLSTPPWVLDIPVLTKSWKGHDQQIMEKLNKITYFFCLKSIFLLIGLFHAKWTTGCQVTPSDFTHIHTICSSIGRMNTQKKSVANSLRFWKYSSSKICPDPPFLLPRVASLIYLIFDLHLFQFATRYKG